MSVWLGYYFAIIKGKLFHNRAKYLNKWFKKKGVNFTGKEGYKTLIYSNIAKNEPYLISIGDNTVIGGNVELITHDYSISRLNCGANDLFGKIIIGNNCFIGARTVILYGVTIGDNVIVAAGSVVSKSILESNVIVAGNPAKVINTWDKFKLKGIDYGWFPSQITKKELKKLQIEEEKYLIKR